MSIDIPVWLVWTIEIALGVPAVLALVALAITGAYLMYALKDGIWR